MAIPDFQSLMLPVLKQFAGSTERRSGDIRAPLAKEFALTPEEIAQRFERGVHTVFGNRVAWAITYLRRATLVESPRRGVYVITQRGRDVLQRAPVQIDIQYLNQFGEFAAHNSASALLHLDGTDPALLRIMTQGIPSSIGSPVLTPDEQVRLGAARIKETLVGQILERVMRGTPAAFERLVVDLLVKMGYGGSYADAAQVAGKSSDGGIDGIIKEDRLGLESIYIQAKRWEGTVGRPVIQQFAGALHGKNARKGVMITTSAFSSEAMEYAKSSPITIVLIDGVQLASLMIEFGVGVGEVETIKINRIDEDYFGADLE